MAYTKADKDGLVPMHRDNNLPANPSVPSFPLDQINVVQLARELSTMLNKPSPKTWIGQYFLSNKLNFEQNKLAQLTSYIEQVRAINGSITNMQAELFLQPTVLQRIIDGDAAGAQRLAEVQIAEHRNAVSKHEDEIKARGLQLESAELDNALKRQRIEVVDFIKNNIKPDDLSPYHKGLLLQAAANPNGVQYQDLSVLQELKDSYLKEAELKNKLLEAQVKKEDSQADISRTAADKTVRDFEELKKRK